MPNNPFSNELIERYVNHATTEEEERAILEWLEEDEENRKEFSDLLLNVSLRSMITDPGLDDGKEKSLDLLRLRIDRDIYTTTTRRNRNVWVTPFCVLAAACMALLLVFTPFLPSQETPGAEEYRYSYTNTAQTVASVDLGDHTRVRLKPGSSILYDVTGLKDRRLVKLCGEAFFDVAKDSLRPFTVKTGDISVEVLGTAFSVRSGGSFPKTEVVLERGSVRILSPEGFPMVTMSPDQKAVFDLADGGLRMETVNAVAYAAEHYRLITLNNASIAEIVKSVEDNFGVDIAVVRPVSGSRRFVFSYSATDSVADILSILEFVSGVRFEIRSTTSN